MNTRKLSNAIKGKLPQRLQHISITRRSMLMLVTFSLLTGGFGFGVMASTPFDEINGMMCDEVSEGVPETGPVVPAPEPVGPIGPVPASGPVPGPFKNSAECEDGQLIHEEDVPDEDDVPRPEDLPIPDDAVSPDSWPCQTLSDQWNTNNEVVTEARRANSIGTSRCEADGTFCVVRNNIAEQCVPNPVDPGGALSKLSCEGEPINLTVISSADPDAALDEIGCVIEDQIEAFFADNIVGASKNINPVRDQDGEPLDQDGDGRLDAYVVTHPDVTAQTGGGVYVQADFIYGPLSDREPMVIDATTGKNLALNIQQTPTGGLVIEILGGGEKYIAITFDPANNDRVLIFENFDSSSNKIAARKSGDDYLIWSAPTSMEYINIVPGFDWDGDGYFNEQEGTLSHPLNAASTLLNRDGDLCSRAHEGEEADNDPEVCRDQPWDLRITAPDANTTDDLNATVWANTPVNFNITLNQTRAALYDEVPLIQNIYMYVSQSGTGAHKDNATAPSNGNQLTAYDKHCDTVIANSTNSATPKDGTPVKHYACPVFAKGYFIAGQNGAPDTVYTPHLLCAYNPDVLPIAAHASLIQGLDQATLSDLPEMRKGIDLSCPFDTTILDDGGDYHVYSHICFVGENCARTLNAGHKADKTDLRDRTDLSHHFNITNKPVFTLLNMTDADGSTDRDGYISDDAVLDFYGNHTLGQPLASLEFDIDPYWEHADAPAGMRNSVDGPHYSFNFSGDFPRHEESGLNASLERHPTLPDTYRVTMDSTEWNFNLIMVTNAKKGGVKVDDARLFAVDRPANHIESWTPLKEKHEFVNDAVRFFNNARPVITTPSVLSNDRGSVTQTNTTVVFTAKVADPDLAGAPAIQVNITKLDANGQLTDETYTTKECVQLKASLDNPRDRGVEGAPAPVPRGSGRPDNDVYDCTWRTPENGSFAWHMTVIDKDATDNVTEEPGQSFVIANAPTVLSQGTVSVVGYNETGGTRQRVEVYVRYEDADDAPAIVLANITKDDVLFRQAELRPYTPTEAAEDVTADSTCGQILNAGALSSAATDDRHLRHYCGVIWLPDGDYNATFWAEALRDGAGRFPADPSQAIPVDVGGAGVDCGHCGGFEEQSQGGADAYRTTVVAINAALEEGQPLPGVNGLRADVNCKRGQCPVNDDDDDGWSNEQEAGVSDPNNPFSTPEDADADLVPDGLENAIDIDLWYVRADGFLQMKESGSVTLCGAVSTSTCGDGALTLAIRPEQGGLYNLSLDVGSTETWSSGVPYVEYTVLPTGIELQVIDPRNDKVLLFLQLDAAKLASTDDAPVKLHVYGSQSVMVNVTTAPVDVEYHSFNSNLEDSSAYKVIYTRPVPQVEREKADGSWEHCVKGTCVDLIGLPRVGFRDTENGGREAYVDPQDNGGETQVGGNNLLCYEASPVAQLAASASDADCDGYTNVEELSSCSDPTSKEDTLIQGQPTTPCGERGLSGTPNDCIEEPGRFHHSDVDCDGISNGEEIGSQISDPGNGYNPVVSE